MSPIPRCTLPSVYVQSHELAYRFTNRFDRLTVFSVQRRPDAVSGEAGQDVDAGLHVRSTSDGFHAGQPPRRASGQLRRDIIKIITRKDGVDPRFALDATSNEVDLLEGSSNIALLILQEQLDGGCRTIWDKSAPTLWVIFFFCSRNYCSRFSLALTRLNCSVRRCTIVGDSIVPYVGVQ